MRPHAGRTSRTPGFRASPAHETVAKGRDDKDGGGKKADGDTQDKRGETKDQNDDDQKDGDQKGGDKKDDGKGGKGDKKRSRWPLVIVALVLLAAIIGAVFYWYSTKDDETTDDAYTEGNAVTIAPKVAGYVVKRLVDDNSFVKAGDLMILIDQRDYINARDQAHANLDLARAQLQSARIDSEIAHVRFPAEKQQAQAQFDQARANLVNAQREDRRQRTVDPRATTQTAIDQANTQAQSNSAATSSAQAQVQIASLVPQNIEATSTTVKQREAQVEQAEASLAQAELNLSYTEIRAPQDGYITRRNVDVGTYAQAGQQVFYLVSPYTWVVANFKETQLARMQVGQHVSLVVDAFPKLKLEGHIDTFQQGAGARFTTFPAENATGNFVKIVRRVPVKIIIDSGVDQTKGLPLGLSVDPTVNLR